MSESSEFSRYFNCKNIDQMFECFAAMSDTKAAIAKKFYIYFDEDNKSKDAIFVNSGDTLFFDDQGQILCVFKRPISERVNEYELIKKQIDIGVFKAKNIRGIMVVG